MRLRLLAFLTILLAAMTLTAGVAYAYWAGAVSGTPQASATAATMTKPSIAATVLGNTVSLTLSQPASTPAPTSWAVSASPSSGITTSGSCATEFPASNSYTSTTSPTNCQYTGVPNGVYTYTLTSTYQSWSQAKTTSSTSVTVTVDMASASALSSTSVWTAGGNCTLSYWNGTLWVQDYNVPQSCRGTGSNGSSLTSIVFTSSSLAIAVGASDTVLMCTSGCNASNAAWSQVSVASNVNWTGAAVRSSDIALSGNLPGSGSGTGGVVYACGSGGSCGTASNWSNFVGPLSTATATVLLNDVGIVDAKHMTAVGGSTASGSTVGYITACVVSGSNTCDGSGATWGALSGLPTSTTALNAVAVEDKNDAVAVGGNSTLGFVWGCASTCGTGSNWARETGTGSSTWASTDLLSVSAGSTASGGKNSAVISGAGGYVNYCAASISATCVASSSIWQSSAPSSGTTKNLLGVSGVFSGSSVGALAYAIAVGGTGSTSHSTDGTTWSAASPGAVTEIAIAPTTGSSATSVALAGTGFAISSALTGTMVTTGNTAAGSITLSSSTSSATGTVSATFSVPAGLTPGTTYYVKVVDAAGNVALAPFTAS